MLIYDIEGDAYLQPSPRCRNHRFGSLLFRTHYHTQVLVVVRWVYQNQDHLESWVSERLLHYNQVG